MNNYTVIKTLKIGTYNLVIVRALANTQVQGASKLYPLLKDKMYGIIYNSTQAQIVYDLGYNINTSFEFGGKLYYLDANNLNVLDTKTNTVSTIRVEGIAQMLSTATKTVIKNVGNVFIIQIDVYAVKSSLQQMATYLGMTAYYNQYKAMLEALPSQTFRVYLAFTEENARPKLLQKRISILQNGKYLKIL